MATATITAATTEDNKTGINRREFLYYVMGASIALFSAEMTGLIIWFLIPRFRDGEFGGRFPTELAIVPDVNQPPVANDEGRFWLVNLDVDQPNQFYSAADESDTGLKGVAAVYKVCTHLGCIYGWNENTNRFECPCHGSKYRLDGRRIESPAPRTLDRFQVIALDANGTELASSDEDADGQWLPLVLPEGTTQIAVDTGAKKEGSALKLICEIEGAC